MTGNITVRFSLAEPRITARGPRKEEREMSFYGNENGAMRLAKDWAHALAASPLIKDVMIVQDVEEEVEKIK